MKKPSQKMDTLVKMHKFSVLPDRPNSVIAAKVQDWYESLDYFEYITIMNKGKMADQLVGRQAGGGGSNIGPSNWK